MQKLGEKIRKILAGNWWVGVVQYRGCSKKGPALEERREEKKLLFGWRLHRMCEDRLARGVVAFLNDYRGWRTDIVN